MRSSSNRNSDGMFVRRRSPQFQRRSSLDGMTVPSRFMSNNTSSTAANPSVPLPEPVHKDAPPVLSRSDAAANTRTFNQTPPSAHKSLDIDMTLDDEPKGKSAGKSKKRRRLPFLRKPSRRTVKWTIIIVVLLLLIIGGIFAYRIFVASSHIFQGNVFTAAFSKETPLKTDQYGRTNLLVFGTSESDPGHPAAQLTDSIMIVSIDQKNNTAFLASVPRDLWVKFDSGCTYGYQGKINVVYECASNDGKDEIAGQQALTSKVGNVFGVDFQYTVHLNLQVLKQAVDALGGIDVVIESSDPRGILDRNFDWRCNYKCNLVKYPNGPAHLDGEHAMWLAQARNDAGGYGLPRSNFDREANQRKIVVGMKEKATSAGFLANPVSVTQFVESLGNNVHTTVDASEIKTFIKVAKNIDAKNIQSVSIIDQTPAILTTGPGPDGSSVVKAVSGLYDYSAIQQFMKRQLQGYGVLIAEGAKVDVLNASGATGAANTQAEKLKESGITIGNVATAPDMPGKYMLYDLSGGKKPATLKKLQEQLGLQAPTGTTVPAGVQSTADFVVIIGQAGASSATSQ